MVFYLFALLRARPPSRGPPLLGGRHPDKIAAYGDDNRLHGHTEDDSLWVPIGFTGNSIDGGPHISSDTCGNCVFSATCVNCP